MAVTVVILAVTVRIRLATVTIKVAGIAEFILNYPTNNGSFFGNKSGYNSFHLK